MYTKDRASFDDFYKNKSGLLAPNSKDPRSNKFKQMMKQLKE